MEVLEFEPQLWFVVLSALGLFRYSCTPQALKRLKDEQRVLRRHACFVRSSPSSPVLCAAQSLFLHAVAISKGNRDGRRQTSNLSFTRCTGAG